MRVWRRAKSSVRSAIWCTKPYYISRPESWSFHLRTIDSRIAINHEHKFIYVRIPKAANTTITYTLYWMINGRLPDSGGHAKQSFHNPRELTFEQARAAKNDYFKFIFVREPFGRVLSAYLDKVAYVDHPRPPIFKQLIRQCLGIRDDVEISFDLFCQYLEQGGLHDDPHWIPQERYARLVGVKNLDFVGRMENLGNDIAHVSSIIFPRKTYEFQDETWQYRSNAQTILLNYYTEECEEIVRTLYRRDFECFGYDDTLKR